MEEGKSTSDFRLLTFDFWIFAQTNCSPSRATPHSNHFFFFASQPRRWTGEASSSSFENMMPLQGGCFGSLTRSIQLTLENSLNRSRCQRRRFWEGSRMTYSIPEKSRGRKFFSQLKMSAASCLLYTSPSP